MVKNEVDWDTQETESQRVQLFREWQIHWYRWTLNDMDRNAQAMHKRLGDLTQPQITKYLTSLFIGKGKWLQVLSAAAHKELTNQQLMQKVLPEGFRDTWSACVIPERWQEYADTVTI